MPLWTVRCECVKTVRGWCKEGDVRVYANIERVSRSTVHMYVFHTFLSGSEWRITYIEEQDHEHGDICGCLTKYTPSLFTAPLVARRIETKEEPHKWDYSKDSRGS